MVEVPAGMNGAKDVLSAGDACAVTAFLSGFLPEDDGKNTVFRQKAGNLIRALVPVLVILRD